MGYLNLAKVTIFVALTAFFGRPAFAVGDSESFDTWINQLPGYSAQLSLDFCKATFPYHKNITRAVSVRNSAPSFHLFAFTALPFEPSKPSIVTIHGGPGGLWGPSSALELANAFPASNVIFFHYRGGGCSDFRTTSIDWDVLLNSNGVIDDMEAIRREYGISYWQGVLGWSYGTNIARRYAHLFPNKVGLLVLEGLDNPDKPDSLSSEQQIQRLLSSIENRIRTSSTLAGYASAINIQNFLDVLRSYFSQVSPETNFGYAAAWDKIKGLFEESYRKSGQQIPKYISLPTFQAISLLMYAGEEANADVAVLILMDQFGLIQLDSNTKDNLVAYFSIWDRMMFPFKYPKYSDIFAQGLLVSWRVQLKMTENDKSLPAESLCTSHPVIVINGTKDLATPVEGVEEYLKNKTCARGTNAAIFISGGGHSNLGSMACLAQYVNKSFHLNRPDQTAPTGCSLPVVLKTY